MPIMKKLIRYATKAGHWLLSCCSRCTWLGPATVRLRASSVMATAKTPSLNASSLDRSILAPAQPAAGLESTFARI